MSQLLCQTHLRGGPHSLCRSSKTSRGTHPCWHPFTQGPAFQPCTGVHGPAQRRPQQPFSIVVCSSPEGGEVDTTRAATEVADPEKAVKVGWDPEGLFASAPEPVDWLSRREKKQQAAAQPQQAQAAISLAAAPSTLAAAQLEAAPPPAPAAHTSAVPTSATSSSTATRSAAAATAPAVPAAVTPAKASAAAPAPAAVPPAQAAAAATIVPSPTPSFSEPLRSLPAAAVAAGGWPTSSAPSLSSSAAGGGCDSAALAEKLRTKFMPLDLEYPGVRVLHWDPVVITVDDFMPPEICQAWIEAAEESGCLSLSKVGAGNASTSGGPNAYTSRRTSSSMLLDTQILDAHASLKELLADLHTRAWNLLDAGGGGKSWQLVGRMPRAGQYGFESPQVARYNATQHFKSHEDAFPRMMARANGFQRHATLLTYLNDVPQGGATAFDHLGIAVKPKQGKALLFFPAYADGTPDERTLHAAEDALDTKYVIQQWIVRGWQNNPTVASAPQPERVVMTLPATTERSSKATAGKGKKKRKGSKGFQK